MLKIRNVKQGSFGFVPPAASPVSAVSRPLLDLSLSPAGALMLLAGEEGYLQLYSVSDGSLQRTLVGHQGDVYTARFFPSGEVALSVRPLRPLVLNRAGAAKSACIALAHTTTFCLHTCRAAPTLRFESGPSRTAPVLSRSWGTLVV
jgi:WD40 repeat protein